MTGWLGLLQEAGGPYRAEAEQLGQAGWDTLDPDHLFTPGNWHPEYIRGWYNGRRQDVAEGLLRRILTGDEYVNVSRGQESVWDDPDDPTNVSMHLALVSEVTLDGRWELTDDEYQLVQRLSGSPS